MIFFRILHFLYIHLQKQSYGIIFKRKLSQNQQKNMTNWYGQTSTKQQIDALLQKKPKLSELFTINEFCQQLKSFNPKLLDFMTSNPELIKQAIVYLTVAPNLNDTSDRKYKLPLLSVQMIETQTTSVLNSFFKENKEEPNQLYFDSIFTLLNSLEVLPLLASYFFRVNLCLLNNRFRDTVDRVYKNSQWLLNLLNHCQHMPITNVLQLYINLDVNKSASSQTQNQRLNVKMQLLGKVIAKISNQSKIKSAKSYSIIENLTGIFIETIQKYYLIADGKQMMDVITSQLCIDTMLSLLKESGELAYPAMNFFIALINYYSFSSLNSEQKSNPQLSRKNLQRLQRQPMIVGINAFFKPALCKIMENNGMNLHSYRILQVLCHMISISSLKVFNTIKQSKFFECLITLLFKYPQCNILHMLIEKSFLHVFISDRTIYDDYKRFLFCEMNIIDVTATRFLDMFPDQKSIALAKKKGYFGHFMRILKIYSGIQTTDEQIVAAIKSKGDIWNKISKVLVKPYQNVCFKQLGSYTDIPQQVPLEFKIKNDLQLKAGDSKTSNNTIQDIIRQQQLKNQKALQNQDPSIRKQEDSLTHSTLSREHTSDLFKNPALRGFTADSQSEQNQYCKQANNSQSNQITLIRQKIDTKNQATSYQQFKSRKTAQIVQQRKRSLSNSQKRLSAKKKMSSPSPNKKNSWKQDGNSDESSQKAIDSSISRFQPGENARQTPRPKIPISRERENKKGMNTSLVVQRKNNHFSQSNVENQSAKDNKSIVSLEQIKKIRVIQIDKPAQKKYRRMEAKDKLLLDFLGIAY